MFKELHLTMQLNLEVVFLKSQVSKKEGKHVKQKFEE